jgi:hypothetical protein
MALELHSYRCGGSVEFRHGIRCLALAAGIAKVELAIALRYD